MSCSNRTLLLNRSHSILFRVQMTAIVSIYLCTKKMKIATTLLSVTILANNASRCKAKPIMQQKKTASQMQSEEQITNLQIDRHPKDLLIKINKYLTQCSRTNRAYMSSRHRQAKKKYKSSACNLCRIFHFLRIGKCRLKYLRSKAALISSMHSMTTETPLVKSIEEIREEVWASHRAAADHRPTTSHLNKTNLVRTH